MEVQEKRALLEAINLLVKRPAQADEETLGTAMAYFKMLVEEATAKQIQVDYIGLGV